MIKKLSFFFVSLLTFSSTQCLLAASENYGNITVDKVTEVYDGDSFKVNIKAWPAIIGKEVIIRVKGVDAPEIHGKCEKEILMARLARQHTANLIEKSFRVELRNLQRDRYFRILADVYIDRVSLGNSLLTNELAVPYSGGPLHNWCEE
jgi:endonuclease YncB( thermonuclease family)